MTELMPDDEAVRRTCEIGRKHLAEVCVNRDCDKCDKLDCVQFEYIQTK